MSGQEFQVGDRVEIDLREIPKKQRQCEIGEITKIWLKFRATPKLREEQIEVWFDDNYIKEEFRMAGGINKLVFGEKDINNDKSKFPVFIKQIKEK